MALEWLFWAGQVTTATRRGFERVYDLPERVAARAVLAAPDAAPRTRPSARCCARAARALGVATDARPARLLPARRRRRTGPRLAELVEAGELLPVARRGLGAAGLPRPAGARRPRRVHARALLSPFDSLVWERERTERLFGFRYRIEIYTPAAQAHARLLRAAVPARRPAGGPRRPEGRPRGGRAARAGGARGAGRGRPRVARPLAGELATMAGWLGLDGVAAGAAGTWPRAPGGVR